jgi:hypothetical protein
VGDKLHLKLNINETPISKKYREGMMKRTLKRELKGTEIAEREAEGFNCSAMLFVCSGYYLIHECMVECCGNPGYGFLP